MTANTLAEITNLNFAYTIEQLSLTELIKQLPEDRQRFYMFGTPIYNNLGDLAISEAQKRFFAENFPEITYIEITEPQTEQAIEELLPLLRSDDMIGYVGGGNIGNLHITHEIARRKVFSTFVNNKTISFPQSVYFEETEEGQAELRKSQEAYNKNSNLTLVARDTQTLSYFQNHFKADAILTTDMVLLLQEKLSGTKRDGVLFIMREDAEKVTSDKLIEQLTANLKSIGDKVEATDTVLSYKAYDVKSKNNPSLDIVRISERHWLLSLKLEQIKAKEVVVTDRLHGMIFSAITQTPCLVFDNNYGKASAFYYDWLQDLDYIQYTTEKDPKKIAAKVDDLKKYEHSDTLDFSHSFDVLIDLIKK
ncbi:polysaccharide pyruvyl transferase family protein [Tetragenococcus halophilus]|uniref:polysaccharide pyruvyl transferase family protein n=1 Tax=Tetragenococcus halophilus TaxID=51669 RepID=UPI0030EACAFC